MNVIRLFDSEKTLKLLSEETINVIHYTNAVAAIKRLLKIHDILDLNMYIQKNFKFNENETPWDISALRELNITRAEVFIYHHIDFNPYEKIYMYNNKLCSLLRKLAHTYERDDLFPITEL